jgi:amino acid transporter
MASLGHPAGGDVTFDTLSPGNLLGPGVGAILALAVLGFVGFESAAVYGEESRESGRTVRVATYLAVAVIAALYAFASWAMSVATGPDQIVAASREQGPDLVFNLAQVHLGAVAAEVGRVLFVTSLLAAMISFHNTTARYVFALGREHVVPAVLGRTSTRTGSPYVGSITQSLVGLAVIITYAAAGWDPLVRLFFWGGTVGGLGILVLIAATSIAVIVFLARYGPAESAWRRVVAPVLSAAAIAFVLWLALANFATLLGVDESSPLRWGIPIAYLAIAVLGMAWGLVLRAVRPQQYAAIGSGSVSAAGRQ